MILILFLLRKKSEMSAHMAILNQQLVEVVMTKYLGDALANFVMTMVDTNADLELRRCLPDLREMKEVLTFYPPNSVNPETRERFPPNEMYWAGYRIVETPDPDILVVRGNIVKFIPPTKENHGIPIMSFTHGPRMPSWKREHDGPLINGLNHYLNPCNLQCLLKYKKNSNINALDIIFMHEGPHAIPKSLPTTANELHQLLMLLLDKVYHVERQLAVLKGEPWFPLAPSFDSLLPPPSMP